MYKASVAKQAGTHFQPRNTGAHCLKCGKRIENGDDCRKFGHMAARNNRDGVIVWGIYCVECARDISKYLNLHYVDISGKPYDEAAFMDDVEGKI